jgi:Cu(I)-responsive transcriptional regulator
LSKPYTKGNVKKKVMNISKASKLSDLTVKTVRYYANIELVKPKQSSLTGYRDYSDEDVLKLKFIGKARKFNFSIDECRELLSLYENENRPSKEVKKITLEKISEIDQKLNDLKTLRKELSHLANNCHGDDKPNCPILEALSKK